MSEIISNAAARLEKVLEGKVDPAHGIDHALAVLNHVEQALSAHPGIFTVEQHLAVRLAALLHDADDSKFFKGTQNARKILEELVYDSTVDLAMKMIDLVSCSKNGNSTEGVEHEWMLYPRYADRLEAIGEVGIKRCWQYTLHVGRPHFIKETPRATTKDELYQIASKERFEHYVNKQGKMGSSSFIDHFYDKLLHIADLGSNKYFQTEAKKRLEVMEEFLIKFGSTGELDMKFNQ